MSHAAKTEAAKALGAAVPVRMGALAVSNDPAARLSVIGIGSCVALTIVSPKQHVAGVAHVVLPDSQMAAGRTAPPGKFADTAVPALVERMTQKGADVRLMQAVLVGGAAMFGGRVKSSVMAIGEQNVEALTVALDALGIRVAASDVGGVEGRTLHVDVGEGRVLARTIAGTERLLFPDADKELPIARYLAA
jgi:chemotaxis protein CheD